MRFVVVAIVGVGLGIAGFAGVVGWQMWQRAQRPPADPKVSMLSTGERIFLGAYVQGPRPTVVVFVSGTTTSGRAFGKRLDTICARRPDVRVRVVDIGEPGSEVRRQFGVEQAPALWLYRDGKLLSDDTERVWQLLESLP